MPGCVYLQMRYLLTQCIDNGNKYNYMYIEYDEGLYAPNHNYVATRDNIIHGPAVFTDCNGTWRLPSDAVRCVRCLVWPPGPQAATWPTRHRNYGWQLLVVLSATDVTRLVWHIVSVDNMK